jgi:hypothetical protein
MMTRAAAASAAWGLRAHRGTAALLAVTGAIALAAVLPVAMLVRAGGEGLAPRIMLPMSPGFVDEGWAMARSAPWLQAEAIRLLFGALIGTAAASAAVGALGVLLLSAARASERAGELRLRRAVGASGGGLLVATLLEGAAVALAAVVLGLALGIPAGRIVAKAWPGPLESGALLPPAATAAGFVLVVLAGSTLALLFAPRGRLTEVPARPLSLVAPTLQFGLALVILTASALMARHATGRPTAGAGARPGGEVFRAASTETDAESRAVRYAALLQAVQAGGGFDTVSLTGAGAVVGLGTVSVATTDCGLCPSGGLLVPWHSVTATHVAVSADSFHALGVRLLAGRGLTDADRWGTAPVAVVSRGLAVRHFQQGQAIGRRMLVGDDPRTWHTVVGIVDDAPVPGLGGALLPLFTVYVSVLQHPPRNVELLVRPRPGLMAARSLASDVDRAVGQPAGGVARMSEAALLAAQRAPVAWFGRMFAAEGWTMLLVAVLGTLVQMRLWVRSLAPELGLRRASGARRRQVVGHVVIRAAAVGLGGIMVGLCLGPAVWNALGTIVRGLPAWDAGAMVRLAGLLVVATALGAVVPAWRASRAAPAALLAGD